MQKCFELFLVNSIIREYGAVVKRKTAKNRAFFKFFCPGRAQNPMKKGKWRLETLKSAVFLNSFAALEVGAPSLWIRVDPPNASAVPLRLHMSASGIGCRPIRQ
jgi:hypothetical protein